jgi:hypothetical protein
LRIHRQTISAAKRNKIEIHDIAPTSLKKIPRNVQVVTVCDLVHEELRAPLDWWHWSIPELEARVNQVVNSTMTENGVKS